MFRRTRRNPRGSVIGQIDYEGGLDIRTETYPANGNLLILLMDKYGSLWGDFSSNFAGAKLSADEFVVQTWNLSPKLVKIMMDTGLFKDTGRRERSGYVEAPVWSVKSLAAELKADTAYFWSQPVAILARHYGSIWTAAEKAVDSTRSKIGGQRLIALQFLATNRDPSRISADWKMLWNRFIDSNHLLTVEEIEKDRLEYQQLLVYIIRLRIGTSRNNPRPKSFEARVLEQTGRNLESIPIAYADEYPLQIICSDSEHGKVAFTVGIGHDADGYDIYDINSLRLFTKNPKIRGIARDVWTKLHAEGKTSRTWPSWAQSVLLDPNWGAEDIIEYDPENDIAQVLKKHDVSDIKEWLTRKNPLPVEFSQEGFGNRQHIYFRIRNSYIDLTPAPSPVRSAPSNLRWYMIDSLYVPPADRKLGHAQALAQALYSWADANKIALACLPLSSQDENLSNAQLRDMYIRAGFTARDSLLYRLPKGAL